MTPRPAPRHHPDAALLMAHAAGTLPEAFSLVVATHVSLCDTCRAELAAHEETGGALLEMMAEGGSGHREAAMDQDGVLEKVLERAQALPEAAPPAPPAPGTDLPEPLAAYVGGGMDAIPWRRVGGGIRQAVLDTGRDASARLLYIPGGRAVPDHGHRGLELTLVLSGAFSDSEDRFGPGDLELATPELEHTPVADPGAPCICLAATDAPLRFTGLLPRLAQRLMGI